MRWTIYIEDKPNTKIIVTYLPLEDLLVFTGEFKLKNGRWFEFTKESVSSIDINLAGIQSLFSKSSTKLIERVDKYNDLNSTFNVLDTIKIEEED
jgi:hypothetical protein